jgi:hypothetical protein
VCTSGSAARSARRRSAGGGELLSVPLSIGFTSVEVEDTIDSLLQRAECVRKAIAPRAAASGSTSARS